MCAVVGHDGSVEWAQFVTIIAAIAGFTSMQAFWIARAIDAVGARIDRLETRMERLETRMNSLETALRDLGERVARLEGPYRDSPAA